MKISYFTNTVIFTFLTLQWLLSTSVFCFLSGTDVEVPCTQLERIKWCHIYHSTWVLTHFQGLLRSFPVFWTSLLGLLLLFFFFKLLALTIQHEKPDLEEQKTKLLQQEEDKKIQLARLEESLLEVMSFQSGFHIAALLSNRNHNCLCHIRCIFKMLGIFPESY